MIISLSSDDEEAPLKEAHVFFIVRSSGLPLLIHPTFPIVSRAALHLLCCLINHIVMKLQYFAE